MVVRSVEDIEHDLSRGAIRKAAADTQARIAAQTGEAICASTTGGLRAADNWLTIGCRWGLFQVGPSCRILEESRTEWSCAVSSSRVELGS